MSKITEKGAWEAILDAPGNVLIQSDDFTHDVTLDMTGDFANDDDKLAYAEKICEILNAAMPFTLERKS